MLGIQFYLHSLDLEQEVADEAFYALKYEDLLQEPVQSILKIFQFFHWIPSDQFLWRLAQEKTRQETYQSKHSYSLEKYNLQKAEIYEALRPVFEKYNWQV